MEKDRSPAETGSLERGRVMSGDLSEPLSVSVPSGGHQESHMTLVDEGVGDLGTRAVGLEVGSHEAFKSEGSSP